VVSTALFYEELFTILCYLRRLLGIVFDYKKHNMSTDYSENQGEKEEATKQKEEKRKNLSSWNRKACHSVSTAQ
jgi:hypothetical protein